MEELIIDEKNIAALLKGIVNLVKTIDNDVSALDNKEGDIFGRYMAYVRLSSISKNLGTLFKISKEMMVMGHAINHPVFQTQEAKENGWDGTDIESNPFFSNSRNKNMMPKSFEALPDAIKDLIREEIDKVQEKTDSGKVAH